MTSAKLLNIRNFRHLTPSTPFHFDSSFYKPAHFPSGDTTWRPGARWQTMLWQGIKLGLLFENDGTVDEPGINLSIWSEDELSNTFLNQLLQEIYYRYALNLDLSKFYHQFQNDSLLGPALIRWRGMRPLNCVSLYEYLIIAIVLQNATVRRTVTMMQILFENYGTLVSYDNREFYCFWVPEQIEQVTEQELRNLKVGYRAKSIKRVSEAFSKKQIDEYDLRRRSYDEQRKSLLDLYGIGPASVGYILSDVFHYLDELNYISHWEQKIYSKLFFDVDPENPIPTGKLLSYFKERFGEFRSIAILYIWDDLFWKWKNEGIEWLDKLIRL